MSDTDQNPIPYTDPRNSLAPGPVLPDGSSFFVQTVMSREEAMRLPPNKRPLCHRVSSAIYHAVFEAVGAASLCWNPRPAGQFDAEQASKFSTDCLFKIAEDLERGDYHPNIDGPAEPVGLAMAQSESLGFCSTCDRPLTPQNCTLMRETDTCDVCVRNLKPGLPVPPPTFPNSEARLLLQTISANLRQRAQFHRSRPDDVHQIANAVICALEEVDSAIDDTLNPQPPAA